MPNSIQIAQHWLTDADAILVTASNGLSISEGLNLFAQDAKLHQVLGDLADKYPLSNLLTALSYHYPDTLDQWRAYARITEYYSHNYHSSSLMTTLKHLLGNKPTYFWTSNIDHHFDLAGFQNTFEIEGNWLSGVCREHPQKHGTVDLSAQLHQIYLKDQAGTLTLADRPTCDQCGAPLVLNLAGEAFQADKTRAHGFTDFLQTYQNQKLLVLELGIGPQNQLIKAPSMQLVADAPHSHYLTINKGQLYIPDNIIDRAIGFSSTIDQAFHALTTGQAQGLQIEGPTQPHPQLTPQQQAKQEQAAQPFLPFYMVNQGIRPGELTMYLTIDAQHPAHFHFVERGQAWMYSMGDAVVAHCFTQEGKYYQVQLGLDKTKDQVHGFYVEAGTFIAFEHLTGDGAGFSQISGNIPPQDKGQLMVPKPDALIKLFPEQRALIERLAVTTPTH